MGLIGKPACVTIIPHSIRQLAAGEQAEVVVEQKLKARGDSPGRVETMDLQPRLIRLKDAARCFGMDKNRFNTEVRPCLTEIPIGKQGVGFDRLDLKRWFEEYKTWNFRPRGGQG